AAAGPDGKTFAAGDDVQYHFEANRPKSGRAAASSRSKSQKRPGRRQVHENNLLSTAHGQEYLLVHKNHPRNAGSGWRPMPSCLTLLQVNDPSQGLTLNDHEIDLLQPLKIAHESARKLKAIDFSDLARFFIIEPAGGQGLYPKT
ncbi:unnamed protein product, partial [Amoebophrya sp. A120]